MTSEDHAWARVEAMRAEIARLRRLCEKSNHLLADALDIISEYDAKAPAPSERVLFLLAEADALATLLTSRQGSR